MDANEQYVRERWENVIYRDTAFSVVSGPHYVIIEANRKQLFAAYRNTAEEAWAAAAAFTREREEECRQLRAEIDEALRWLKELDLDRRVFEESQCRTEQVRYWAIRQVRVGRILSRLESILSDKQAGMKQHKEGGYV